jgi:cytochrome c553
MNAIRGLVAGAALAALAAGAPLAARAEANARGGELFELCVQCHGSAGEGNPLALAPNIAGLAEWYVLGQLKNFKSGVRGTHRDDVGGLRMYPMSLSLKSDEDMQAVAAYVASLPPVRPEATLAGGDPARGAQLYTICVACHGADGAGNQAVQSPRLAGQADWYMLSSLQKLKAGTRGNYPNAAIMRGMAGTLVDEQAMKDVIAHILTLSSGSANAAQ